MDAAKQVGGAAKDSLVIAFSRFMEDEVSRAILKTTSHTPEAPNDKHMKRLITASKGADPNLKMDDMLDMFQKRLHVRDATVVLKSLVTLHCLLQVAPRWADFERQCFTACSRLEERLLRLRGVIAPAASGRPSGPQLTTAWGLDAPAHEAELARISGPPVATIKRCVLLHLNSLRHFFCHFVDPIPEGTFLQVYYGGALARPDVPTSAPFLTSLGPGGVRFRHCGVSDAACVEAINRIWTEADQEYAPAVPFVLICAHDLYFRLAKQFPSGRSVRHLNPKSLPLPAILTEVAGRPQPNP